MASARVLAAPVALALVLLAGCAGGTFAVDAATDAPRGCGGNGQLCCAGSRCTGTQASCVDGRCVGPTACGEIQQPCCAGNSCKSGRVCMDRTCQAPTTCGNLNQKCCAAASCNDLMLTCINGQTCQMPACGTIGKNCCKMPPACFNGLVCTNGQCSTVSGCGNPGQQCCTGNHCYGGFDCQGGLCVQPPPCGKVNQPCCSGTCECGLNCTSGMCVHPTDCGGASQPCCACNECNSGYSCNGTTCDAIMCSVTGASCEMTAQCCTNLNCFGWTDSTPGSCQPCGASGQSCCEVSPGCRMGLSCEFDLGDPLGYSCQATPSCAGINSSCSAFTPCCTNLTCKDSYCCRAAGQDFSSSSIECCSRSANGTTCL